MRWLWFFLLLCTVVFCVLQISWVAPAGIGRFLSLPVVFIVSLLLSPFHRHAVWFALIVGFLLDVFSPFPFGLHLITFVATAVVVELLYLNSFTNRSIYALVLLMLAATVMTNALWYALCLAVVALHPALLLPGLPLLSPWQLLGNLLGGVIIFYGAVYLQSFFGRYFLSRRYRLSQNV
ncbi:MAG: hypothetical protein V1778_03150 [bacterium]